MQKRSKDKVGGQKTIKWWKCSGDTAVTYKERLTLDYGKLGTSTGTVEEEWKTFKDAFVGAAECGIMSGKGDPIKKENQTRWMKEVAKAIGETREVWKMIEVIKENGEHIVQRQKKGGKKSRGQSKEKEELYRKLDEEKRLIYKLAHERDEDSKDEKGGKEGNGGGTIQKVRQGLRKEGNI